MPLFIKNTLFSFAFKSKRNQKLNCKMMLQKRISLLLIFVFITLGYASGQKLRYKDFKDETSTKNYRERIVSQKYSPLAAGLGNYFFPGAGYLYIGEPLRGACFFGGELLTSSVMIYGFVISFGERNNNNQISPARALMISGLAATGIIRTWSIFDVVHVAKVKNLVYQETGFTFRVQPDLMLVNQHNSNNPTLGFKLSLNF